MSTLYRIIVHAHVYVCDSINCEHRKNSRFAFNRYSQLKKQPMVLYINYSAHATLSMHAYYVLSLSLYPSLSHAFK